VEEGKNPWPLAWGLTSVCIFVLFGGFIFILFAAQPEPVGAVTALAVHDGHDKAFRIAYPQGWKQEGGGRAGELSWAEFSKGEAKIRVNADLKGSLLGDIMKATSGGGGGMVDVSGVPGAPAGLDDAMDADERKPPIQRLHEMGAGKAEKRWANYTELSTNPFNSRMGEGRYSEFTASGVFLTGKLHGYRVTVLSGERLIDMYTICAEKDWAMLKPHYEKVINSLSQ
jgi:hypothetical protein